MRRFPAVAVLCLLAAACGRSTPANGPADPAPDRSAIVVRGSEMTGNVLEGLRTRVPAMTVRREGTRCPQIMFRGQRSAQQQGNPSVYVDGTLMTDTCILLNIQAADVDFVEVYAGGTRSRAGIQRNPFGSILVFRVRR